MQTQPRKALDSNENVTIPCRIVHVSSLVEHRHNSLSNDLTLKPLYAFLLVLLLGIVIPTSFKMSIKVIC